MEISERMKIEFKLDYTESPLWSADDEAKQRYGYYIENLKLLGLQANTIVKVGSLTNLFCKRLNPIYQGFPSFWSGRMVYSFQNFTKHVYSLIEEELFGRVELINSEKKLLTEEIDIDRIDEEFKNFLGNPAKYCDLKGISYSTKERLKIELDKAYKIWQKEEAFWTTL